jgi:hypothetical protein
MRILQWYSHCSRIRWKVKLTRKHADSGSITAALDGRGGELRNLEGKVLTAAIGVATVDER